MKKAIIVGATSGIGKGLAQVLLNHNYKVVITGIESDLLYDLKNQVHPNLTVKYLDCIKCHPSKKILELTKDLGGLDILVLSAGIGNLDKNLGFEVENAANKLNVFAFTEIADWSYRFFEKQGYGHFVAVTSISGLFGHCLAPAYHAAKSYQITYLEGLRQKARRARKNGIPIYITDIRPGYVDTPMTKGKKMIWVASKEKAANQIYKLIEHKKGYGYVTNRWHAVAALIKMIPTWVRVML